MAARKKAKAAEPTLPTSDENSKVMEAATIESPISTTGAYPVFRADMGEGLPPQTNSLLNPDRAK